MVDTTDPNFGVGLVFLVWSLVPIVVSVQLYRHRHVSNLKARGMYQPQAINMMFWAMSVWMAVNAYILSPDETNCRASVGFPLIIMLGMSLYVVQFTILIFRFRIAEKLASVDKSSVRIDDLISGPNSWFIRNRRLITRTYLVWFVVLCAVPAVFGAGLVAGLEMECDKRRAASTLLIMAVVLFWTTFVLIQRRNLKVTDRDAFGIRRELTVSAFCGLACCVIDVPIVLIFGDSIRVYSNTVIMMCTIACWISSIWLPLLAAQRIAAEEQGNPFQGMGDISTLEDLLNIDFGYQSFLSYAQRAFAQENVLFHKAYRDFSRKYDDSAVFLSRDECLRDARALIQQYIVENSPSQVNIPASCREELLEAFAKVDAALPQLLSSSASSASTATSSPATTLGSSSMKVKDKDNTAEVALVTLTTTSSSADVGATNASTPLMAGSNNSNLNLASTSSSSSSSSSSGTATATATATVNPMLTTNPISASASMATHTNLGTALGVVSLFTRAAKEVYILMVGDVLPRYIQSEEFVEFVKHMKELADARSVKDKDLSKTADSKDHSKQSKPKDKSKDKDKDKSKDHKDKSKSTGKESPHKKSAVAGAGAAGGAEHLAVPNHTAEDDADDEQQQLNNDDGEGSGSGSGAAGGGGGDATQTHTRHGSKPTTGSAGGGALSTMLGRLSMKRASNAGGSVALAVSTESLRSGDTPSSGPPSPPSPTNTASQPTSSQPRLDISLGVSGGGAAKLLALEQIVIDDSTNTVKSKDRYDPHAGV